MALFNQRGSKKVLDTAGLLSYFGLRDIKFFIK